jgi:hypothetical protein
VVFSDKVTYLTFGDYPALNASPIEGLTFAPDQEGILLTVHGPGKMRLSVSGQRAKMEIKNIWYPTSSKFIENTHKYRLENAWKFFIFHIFG